MNETEFSSSNVTGSCIILRKTSLSRKYNCSTTPMEENAIKSVSLSTAADAISSKTPSIRRVYRRRSAVSNPNEIPDSIAKNEALLQAIAKSLPVDYEFEIPKTVWRIEQTKARSVALQMPEGLLMYSCIIADILRQFSSIPLNSISILGDVTYGACCIDDLGAKALGADLLVHYGHSCLVPINATVVPCLYVFVEIRIDVQHLFESFCKTCNSNVHSYVMGTVQFRSAVAEVAALMNERGWTATIPKASPLSPGEVLGCTAPSISSSIQEHDESHVMLFIADGRFHLEAAMIANPTLRALRYDPYSKVLTDERYETIQMMSLRRHAIQTAASDHVNCFGIILGTLGRQGNVGILANVRNVLKKHGKKSFVVLLSEIFPAKLNLFHDVDAWVQIACPRLSVDWGHFFKKPLLTAYELHVCLGEETFRDIYPMDFYSSGSGVWTNYHPDNRDRRMKNI